MIISIHDNSKQNYMHILIAIWHFILFLRFAWDRLWDVEGAPGIWHFVLLLRFAWDRPWDVEGAPDIWHFVLFLRFAWDRLWDVEGSPGQIRCLSYLLQLPAITKSSQSFLCGRVRQTCHRWSPFVVSHGNIMFDLLLLLYLSFSKLSAWTQFKTKITIINWSYM